MICPKCNTKNSDEIKFCSQCGTALPECDELDISGCDFKSSMPGTMSGIKTSMNVESIAINLKKGSTFADRYEILNDGVKGGMGIVFKVKDNMLGDIKALKLILPAYLENEKAVSRFKQEVATTQKLVHENIIRVYDIGEAKGALYFTMEWIDGISMRDFIDERKKQNNRLSLEEAQHLITQVCSALSYAHKNFQITHRDIKPENLLIIAPYTKSPKIRIADFGIAKTESQSIHHSMSAYMGTPIYMAPEQYTDASKADNRADIYSVGAVLYELLTFFHPLGTFQMPSEINHVLPKKVDDIIRKALSSDRTKRYNDAMDIITELKSSIQQRIQQTDGKAWQQNISPVLDSSTSKKDYGQTDVSSKPTKKNATAIIAVAALILLAIGGFTLYTDNKPNKSQPTEVKIINNDSKLEDEQIARLKQEAEVKKEREIREAEVKREREIREAEDAKAISQYLEEGRNYFNRGKYELSIEKMKEVLKRDRDNHEAERYIRMAENKLDQIEREFRNPTVGRSR